MTLVPPSGDVGALDEIAEFALAQPRPQTVAQRGHAAIGQGGADPHPVDFLGRLDLAQPRHSARLRLAIVPNRAASSACCSKVIGPMTPTAPSRAPRCSSTAIAAPIDEPPPQATSARRRELSRQRHVIDVLHEHGVGLAGREHADRLGGHRPAGQPLHRGAEAVGAAKDEMVERRLVEQVLDRGPAARHLGVGEARVFGVEDGLQTRRQREVRRLPARIALSCAADAARSVAGRS